MTYLEMLESITPQIGTHLDADWNKLNNLRQKGWTESELHLLFASWPTFFGKGAYINITRLTVEAQ
jgi:hypothetical protein